MSGFDIIVLNNLGGGQSVHVKKLPAPGESVKGYNWSFNIDAGKGPNSAICMSRLGARVAFIGKAGRDDAGDRGEKWMREAGVDVSGLLRSDTIRTGQGVRIMEEGGRNIVICGESSSHALTLKEVREQIRRLQPAKYFFTGFEIREELTLGGARYAKELGMITVLNLSPVPPAELGALDYIDYVAVNEVEGAALSGVSNWKDLPPREICKRITDKYHCGCVLLTLGPDGSVGLKGDKYWTVQPGKVDVVDTIGAGDAFLSAFTVNLLWGKDEQAAAQWANKFASLTTTRRGSIPSYPTLNEIKSYME